MVMSLTAIFNRLLQFLSLALIGLVVFFCIFGVYGAVKMGVAKKRVQAISDQVSIGMQVGDAEKRARALQLNVTRFKGSGDRNGRVSLWNGFLFGRYFCDLDYRDGKVVGKNLTH